MAKPIMAKATAVWLVDNTTISFKQIADFVGMHELEIQGIADGDVAAGVKGFDPIWFGNPRDLTAVVGGNGGFLMRLGSGDSEISQTADVYTFPIGNPSQDGVVALSVEAEVNGANCNRVINADTLQIHAGGDIATNTLEIAMPECGATGDFLVLKNLLEDLTIAQNN